MNAQKLSTTEQFQVWLVHMDDALASFVQDLPHEVASALDQSATSLDHLEAWLLSRYATTQDALPATEAATIGGAARYVGEVFRKHTAGKWSIETTDPSFVFHGLPILHGGTIGEMPICPLTMVTASLHRRRGNYLSTVLKNLSTPAQAR